MAKNVTRCIIYNGPTVNGRLFQSILSIMLWPIDSSQSKGSFNDF
jgi:hypothetical protein